VGTKAAAGAVFDRMKEDIREGKFQEKEINGVLSFSDCVDCYVQRYIKLRELRSGEEMEQRLELLKARWKGLRLIDIRVGEIEDLIADLKARGKKPATINRYLSLLRHMFNWAVGREYLDRTPFRRGNQALIKFERENNRRIRRVNPAEEARLMAEANPTVRQLIVAALDTGMRKGELLTLQFGDIDWERQVIHVRPENAKSKKGRVVPIGTTRLRTLLEFLRIDGEKKEKPAAAFVFTRGDDEALKSFRTAWELARSRANLGDVRFHDLRSEYASRLVEKGVPLSQVRDLLGHCSIVVTERYDRQVLATLKEAVGKLDDGQPFKNLSRSDDQPTPVESLSPTH
jgi:integrase